MQEGVSLRAAPIAIFTLFSLFAGCGESPPTRLLLLITVDTLRADHLGAYGSERVLTPRLDALASESEVFTSAFAPAPFTLPSVVSLLTGRYPESLGVLSNASRVPDSVPTLATELARRGWRAGAVVSNRALRPKAGLARGFQVYDDGLAEEQPLEEWRERSAAETTDAALALLDRLSCAPTAAAAASPAFLWVHYMDPHGPYRPPAELRERYFGAERERFDGGRELPVGPGHPPGLGAIPSYQVVDGRREAAFYRAGYAGEVHYTDREIGRLLDGVRKCGLDDTTLIVFAADHGESLGENDQWFNHGDFLTDALVRVPLFVRRPGQSPRRRTDVVALVDLFPSLLAELDDVLPDVGLPGRNVLASGAESANSRPYLATLQGGRATRIGLVEDGYKLVLWQRGRDHWDAQLYPLEGEELDLSGLRADRVDEMRERLASFRATLATADEVRQQLSAEERAGLAALGYATSEPTEVDPPSARESGNAVRDP